MLQTIYPPFSLQSSCHSSRNATCQHGWELPAKIPEKTPETLPELLLQPGSPKPYHSRHLKRPEHFQNSLPLSTAGDASFFFRSGSGEGLSDLVSSTEGISDYWKSTGVGALPEFCLARKTLRDLSSLVLPAQWDTRAASTLSGPRITIQRMPCNLS